MVSKKLVFLGFSWTLDGFKSSGRPVGTISTYFYVNWTQWSRAMTKNLKELTSKKLTTTLM